MEASTLREFGSRFYGLSVTVTNLICLNLLDNGNGNATDVVGKVFDCFSFENIGKIFDKPAGHFDEDYNFEMVCDELIEFHHGWLVSAMVGKPQAVSFSASGAVAGYGVGGLYRTLTVYADSLEDALKKIENESIEFRHEIFNKHRAECGLTPWTLEEEADWRESKDAA